MASQNQIQIQEKLERRILHGLACQWEEALWILSPSLRESMQKPLFSLRDMKNRLGYWHRQRHEISLSRAFVLNHPWDAVVEVLLHETAHQLADTVLGAYGETPHGPTFQKACHLLRANPETSGSYETLHDRIANERVKSEDKIMVRVKKLMALAESRNQHEAEAAMAKAHELIEKYNIDLLSRNENRNFVSIFIGTPTLRHFREEYHLSGLLQDFYFVSGIWVSAYVLEKEKMGRVLEISGTVQNINIAAYVHDFVRRYIDSKWKEYNKDKGLNRYRKTDFAVGIIDGFRFKLKSENQNKKNTREEFALIKKEDALLEKYLSYKHPHLTGKHPHLTGFRRKVSSQDTNVLNDGKQIGKELVISKGVTEKGQGKKLLIEF